MRKLFTTIFVAALAVAFQARWAEAQQPKPVVVVSIASYDKLMAGIVDAVKLAGVPIPVDKMVEGQINQATGGKGIVGLDKSKPWGAVMLDAAHPEAALVFAPVADLKGLLAALPIPPGQKQELPDGTVQIQGPKPVTLKGAGGWVFASASADGLKNLPADPDKLLGDLPTRYAVAVRVNVQSVPPEMRKTIFRELEQFPAVRRMIEPPQLIGGGEAPESAAETTARKSLKELEATAEQIDELTIGWNTDSATGKLAVESSATPEPMATTVPQSRGTGRLAVELSVTAVPGSQLAQRIGRLRDGATNFAGLRSPEAAISLSASTEATPTQQELDELKAQHEAALARGQAQVDSEQSLPDSAKPVVKEAVATVLAVGFDTLKTGKRDAGLAVFLGPKPALVAGGYVTDADALVQAVKKLAALTKNDAAMPPIKWDAETHAGRTLHVMTLPVPVPPAVSFLGGSSLEVVLAAGKQDIWLCVGTAGVEKVKKVLDDSAVPAQGPAVGLVVRTKAIIDKAASVQPDGPAKQLAAQMATLKDVADQVTLVSSPLLNGVKFRLEVGEGALKAIGSIAPELVRGDDKPIAPPPAARPGGFGPSGPATAPGR